MAWLSVDEQKSVNSKLKFWGISSLGGGNLEVVKDDTGGVIPLYSQATTDDVTVEISQPLSRFYIMLTNGGEASFAYIEGE